MSIGLYKIWDYVIILFESNLICCINKDIFFGKKRRKILDYNWGKNICEWRGERDREC